MHEHARTAATDYAGTLSTAASANTAPLLEEGHIRLSGNEEWLRQRTDAQLHNINVELRAGRQRRRAMERQLARHGVRARFA